MLKAWKHSTPLRQALIYILRVPHALNALAFSASLLFRFFLFSVKIIGKQFQLGFQKNGERSHFVVTEIQALF